ncbi:MAG TPA: gluconate 2-dehydrogenase subunit 3 family protein [Bryobacteraceae bacterium]|jgi:glucoside 3-dehydrogenase (cytochrome c) hitch-hiker subunit|nr:gluconate 2-dehydrogenase subunit 3 family protein [Bryobacteraceae bacterium]
MADRRESLKIIGAIGATCAFPFSADELYGQHVHPAPRKTQDGPYTPRSFTKDEFETVSRIAELIIPATETPGAIGAGVPRYIDEVVTANPEHGKRFAAGLAWLEAESQRRFQTPFMKLGEGRQIELLTPLSNAVDAGRETGAGERFFGIVKRLTADGYYTSQVGLVRELGYAGNTAMEKFPACELPEH